MLTAAAAEGAAEAGVGQHVVLQMDRSAVCCAVDAIDRHILAELQRDGRISNIDLAERVGLSPSPCLQRVKRLTESGVIRRFTAVVDPASVGRALSVTIFADMTSNDPDAVEQFEALVLAIDGVTDFRRMFGHPDYIITIATADLASYETLYQHEIATMRTLARIDSHIPMRVLRDALDVTH